MKFIVFVILWKIFSFVNGHSKSRVEHHLSSKEFTKSHVETSPLNPYTGEPRKRIMYRSLRLENIQRGNFIHVDKTDIALKLLQYKKSKFFLFMRPRRFGRSSFVNTLVNILQAKKSLFKDYYIGNQEKGYKWKEYIVVCVTFMRLNSIKRFETYLQYIASNYGVTECFTNTTSPEGYLFYNLLNCLVEKGKPIAVVFDEYDLPFRDGNEVNRRYFQNIYQILKIFTDRGKIKFIFVTGVSKVSWYAKSKAGTTLNINDISMHKDFASLYGFTIKEIKRYFHEYMAKKAQAHNFTEEFIYQKIKEWYNGYRFTKSSVTVFNPTSLTHYLGEKMCNLPLNFWKQTQSHSKNVYEAVMLTKIKKKKIVLNLEKKYSRKKLFQSLDVFPALQDVLNKSNVVSLPNIPLEVFFYQHGYLTIRSFSINQRGCPEFLLKTPNKETEMALDDAIKIGMETRFSKC